MLLFLLLLATLAPWLYGNHEAGVDASKIAADAAKNQDSLKEKFHAENLLRRAVVAALFTVGITLALGFLWWFGLCYLAYFAAAFGWCFTSHLNALRELPKWYVSYEPNAANTDRMLVWGARKFNRLLAFIRLKSGLRLTRYLTTPEVLAGRVYTFAGVAGFAIFAGAVWINLG